MRLLTLLVLAGVSFAADWPTFRGVNSSGITADRNLPVEFGPDKNLAWRTPLPPGHSSPVIVGERIYLTAYEGEKATARLLAIVLDKKSGKEIWRREVPRTRVQQLHKANSPTSASIATDGSNMYAFFADFGLISFDKDGQERWRVPLGPFNDPMGLSATPILAGKTLLQICDAETGSFFIALDKDTGKQKWRVERPEFTRGFSTPVLYKPKDGPLQVLVTGSYQLTAYQVETGERVWWARGLTWQLKPTPVMDQENIYILGWAGEADPGQQEELPEFTDVVKEMDKNGDRNLSKDEVSNPKWQKAFAEIDLDNDRVLGERDWRMYKSKRAVVNAVRAVKLGGKGDMTGNTLWTYSKSLPNVPSPLLYEGVIYLMKEGGILTTLDARTGAVLKQARLSGAPGLYFASPIAGEGKVYMVSEEGKVTVLKAGGEWEILQVNDLGESVNATPAVVDSKLYIRTHQALYCFAKPGL
jgi:outer membrane protein assembly factor BamB